MKATSTKAGMPKSMERPYLCVADGAIWMAEIADGFVCVDPLDSGNDIGEYRDDLHAVALYDGKVTLQN